MDVVNRIMDISNASLLNKISSILDKETIVGYTADGQALTTKMYNKRLQNTEKQILSGKCVSQDELEREADNCIEEK